MICLAGKNSAIMLIVRPLARGILNWEWLVMLLLIPLFLFAENFQVILLGIIPLFWVIRKIATNRYFPATPLDLSILLFLFMIALSFVAVFDASLSLPKISLIVFGIGLYYAAVHLSRSRSKNIVYILAFVLGSGTVMAIISIVYADWQPPFSLLNQAQTVIPEWLPELPGIHHGVINANEIAGTLNWIAPLMLACLIGIGKRLWLQNKLLLVGLVLGSAITTFTLLATLSRGGILGFTIGLAVIMAFYMQPRWRLVLAVGMVVIALALFFSYQNPQSGKDAFGDAMGLESRIELWDRGILLIADFPLTGVGVNGFRQVVHSFYPLFSIAPDIDVAHGHNHLLQTALDLGLPGLIVYLALWLTCGGILFKTWRYLVKRNRIEGIHYALVAGLSGSLLAGWIFGIFDAVALGSRPTFIWWLLLSLVVSTHYDVCCSEKKETSPVKSPQAIDIPDVNKGQSPLGPSAPQPEWTPQPKPLRPRAPNPLPVTLHGQNRLPF
jgi:putative inorganic carbon (hco3(-)) transporter